MITPANGSELRETGISAIGDVPWGTHLCCFYETKEDLLETLVAYFKAGLDNKEFCVWAVSPRLELEEARRALTRAVPDLDRHLAEGDLEIHSHRDWYLGDGRWDSQRVLQSWRAKLSQSSANGHSGFRAAGDGGWIENDDWLAFCEYEKQVNAMLVDQRGVILCTYPLTTSSGDQVFDVAHIHHLAAARRNGSWETVETSELKKAKAEIQRLNDELEKKVEKRTRELAAINEALRAEIVERKLAEEALRKSEKLFTAFMEHLPGFAWIKDVEGRYIYINETFLQLRNALGKTDAELWPAEIASTYRANDNQVIQTKNTLQTIEPFPKDPEQGCQIVSKFPIFDQDGAVVMVGGASVDISELVQAEKALDAQALRYKTLMETSTDSIYVLDAEGNLLEANAAFLRQRGYTPAEGKNLNFADWDARWSREELQERLLTMAGESAVFQTQHQTKDGSVFDVEVSTTSVQIGEERFFFCVARDITERKRAEEELKREKEVLAKIFKNIPVMIGFVGTDGSVNLVNPEWERTMGWTLKELQEQNVDIFAEAYPDLSYRQKVLDFVAAATGEWADLKIKVRDGRVIDAACAVVHLSGGTKVAIAQDITERKRAADALGEAYHQLRIVSRQLFHLQEEERRHLARELHDEIGQTLTAAKINLRIIAPDVPGTATGRLEDSIALLDRLLAQVRQLSLDLHPSLLDDLGLAPALRSLLDQQARRAGLRTQFSAPESFEKLGSEIQTAGFRIVQEAITNVLRHAKAQFLGVHLGVEDGHLRMKIVDDGDGFEIADAKRRARNGPGFGLMGMRERAALVGGRVEIRSSPGKGTTVEIALPLNGSEKMARPLDAEET